MMSMGLRVRILAITLVCTAITACSSVANFRKPVDDFAQATRDATDALAGLDKQVTDGYADLIRKRVVAGQLLATIETSDCLTESQRCRIVAKDKQGKQEQFPPEPAMRKMVVLMSSVRNYADGLAGIVNADTAAEVTTQVGATVGSLKNLAGTVAKLGGPDSTAIVKLADYATPLGDLFSRLAGQYVAKVQLDGLRRATVDARPVIAGAAQVFATAANEASRVPRALMAEEVSNGIDALRANRNEKQVDAVVASALRYDRVLVAKPPAVFQQLQQSHDSLVAKIQDENVTLAEVIARIEAFAVEAKGLADIVKEFEAVSKK
jgi:hypothetical protein